MFLTVADAPLFDAVRPSRGVVTLAGVAALVVLMGLSAFFSSSEIAMFSLARHRVDALVDDGVPGAATLERLTSDPHRLLITILVGNNLVNIAMSSIATGLCGLYLSRGQSVLAATFGVTALVLLFGESAPKSYAIENTESWALRIARPLQLAEYCLYPLVVTFDHLTRAVNRLGGGESTLEDSYVTRDELRDMIRTGEREGVIDTEERAMLQRILRFRDTIAKEVMTPRLDMTAVPREASVEEAIRACIRSGHGRLPVYQNRLDNVVGLVRLRELVLHQQNDGLDGDGSLDGLIEETLHVPEGKDVDALLQEMRDERVKMAIVIDEFGTTEGLVTLEDIVEEIVGDILDDEEEPSIAHLDERTALVRGEVKIEAVNESFDLDIPEGEEFETISGFVFNRAGRLVEEGETFRFETVDIHVESVEQTRIKRVRIERTESTEPTEPDGDRPEIGV
ncbi:hemolysin family protein [Halopelagius longus]|uniref:Hemolysin, contains CBS domains n=1 Tax=Halopelagius longus TaxID=1236180 RepID=A0A1H1FQ08_9EURY|nr:hemolysin family protein [Halopelagius longus]RDI69984.1 HlyC/CorC family transporter [Halopelagius longus]SDR03082.1 Hemolysin, contains CBS domains [Halopelagius longus]